MLSPREGASEGTLERAQDRLAAHERRLGLHLLDHALALAGSRHERARILTSSAEPRDPAGRTELRLDRASRQVGELAARVEAEHAQPLDVADRQRQTVDGLAGQERRGRPGGYAPPMPGLRAQRRDVRGEAMARYSEPHGEVVRHAGEDRVAQELEAGIELLEAVEVTEDDPRRLFLDERAHGGHRFDELPGDVGEEGGARLEHGERRAEVAGLP